MGLVELDPRKFKLTPYEHQLEGVRFLIKNLYGALFDEMGAGKTKQIIDAMCVLFEHGLIDTVLIVCPSGVTENWKNLEYGEIRKHVWVPAWIGEYSSRKQQILPYTAKTKERLYFLVTNFELVAYKDHEKALTQELKGRRVAIVADEGFFIKSYRAARTKAVTRVRRAVAERAYLLNGSPIGNNILDLYSQMEFLSPRILNTRNFFTFRARHCIKGGYLDKQIIGYKDLEALLQRIKPYVLRRLKKDCLDLPEKIYVTTPIPLGKETWRIYREMRDEMIAFLKGESDAGRVVMTQHAIVKLTRLRQIVGGFVGGVSDEDRSHIEALSTEKLDGFVDWAEAKVEEREDIRFTVWSSFRYERERLSRLLKARNYGVYQVYGGQPRAERESALAEFTSGTRRGPLFFLGNPQAGGFGTNLVTSDTVVYLSNDYNLLTRLQSEDRNHRPGQRNNVLYNDFLATGPDGQKTIDHIIYRAQEKKEDFATWTTNHWVTRLQEE